MEKIFRSKPEDVTEAMLYKYNEVMQQAEVEILKSADVILCTCIVSASTRIEQKAIKQVSWDKCIWVNSMIC